MIQTPTFKNALKFWLKLGCIGFGGPAAQISMLHEEVVNRKRWVSEKKFTHALNYCMLLPGPEAQQLATYTGWLLHGVRGGLAAGLLFVLPSLLILWALSWAYISYGMVPAVAAIFTGLKPAVAALVILAVLKIGQKALKTPLQWTFAILGLAAIVLFNTPFPLIVLIALLAGFLLGKKNNKSASDTSIDAAEESQYAINALQAPRGNPFSWWLLSKQIALALTLWALPLVLLGLFWPNYLDFWKTLALFFTQAALVTFGGAYSVLPYVAQVSVSRYGWLTQPQMLDGLALGETTPGPLIMVLSFVGFIAGHTQSGGHLGIATLGLVVTTYYTFLPCFFYIFIGAPMIEHSLQQPKAQHFMTFIPAAVTGVMAHLALVLAVGVLWPSGFEWGALPNWFSMVWIIISIFAIKWKKVGLMWWILVSGLVYLPSVLF